MDEKMWEKKFDRKVLRKFLALPSRPNLAHETMLDRSSAFFWTVRDPPAPVPPPPYLFTAMNLASNYVIMEAVSGKTARDIFTACLMAYMSHINNKWLWRPEEIITHDRVCARVLRELLGETVRVRLVDYRLHRLRRDYPDAYGGDGELYWACGNIDCSVRPLHSRDMLKLCSGCHQYYYCGKKCYRAHWKSSHKLECASLKHEVVEKLDESGLL